MKLQHVKRRARRGFTLVELAIVLVIAGLILVAALRGTDAIQQAQAARMVSDLRGLQATLLEFRKRTGRLAGDCDNNGVLHLAGNVPISTTLLRTWNTPDGTHNVLEYRPSHRVLLTNPSAIGNVSDSRRVCTIDPRTYWEENINLVWNELRRVGSVDSNRLPRELARHSMGDVFLVTSMRDLPAKGGQWAGVIVAYGIPVWMAEAVDASLDGTATLYGPATGAIGGPANTGRVRLWSGGILNNPVWDKVFTAAANNNTYDQGTSDRDRLVAISFQFTPSKLVN